MKKFLMLFVSLLFTVSVLANSGCDTLTEDNTLILDQDFNYKTVGKLMQEATKIDANLKSGYPICLILYTPGGSIQDGLELFDFFLGLNRPVHTVTMFAASMGFQAVQHLGKRFITRYGVLMAHKARGGFSGEFGDGLSQLDARYGMWLRRINIMDKITINRTNGKQTLRSYRAAYENELWLNGAEAVRLGYADEVVNPQCSDGLKNKTREVIVDGWFMSLRVVFSGCPLNVNPLSVKAMIATNRGKMEVSEFITKNGQFGDGCNSNDKEVVSGYKSYNGYNDDYSKPIIKKQKAGLCASDKKLTIEKVEVYVEKHRKFFSRDLRNHVMKSF